MEDKLACLVKGLWSAWNKSVQICGICGRLIYLWEIIIRGRQKLSSVGKINYPWECFYPWGERNHPWGDLVQWNTKYLEKFVVQIENTQ